MDRWEAEAVGEPTGVVEALTADPRGGLEAAGLPAAGAWLNEYARRARHYAL
jgi:hypothetical protein